MARIFRRPSSALRTEIQIHDLPWAGKHNVAISMSMSISISISISISLSHLSLSLSIYLSFYLSFGSIVDPIKMTPSHDGGMTMRPCAIPCNLTMAIRKCGSLEGSLKDGPGVLGNGTMTQWPCGECRPYLIYLGHLQRMDWWVLVWAGRVRDGNPHQRIKLWYTVIRYNGSDAR